jgi:hypothetical protein
VSIFKKKSQKILAASPNGFEEISKEMAMDILNRSDPFALELASMIATMGKVVDVRQHEGIHEYFLKLTDGGGAEVSAIISIQDPKGLNCNCNKDHKDEHGGGMYL